MDVPVEMAAAVAVVTEAPVVVGAREELRVVVVVAALEHGEARVVVVVVIKLQVDMAEVMVNKAAVDTEVTVNKEDGETVLEVAGEVKELLPVEEDGEVKELPPVEEDGEHKEVEQLLLEVAGEDNQELSNGPTHKAVVLLVINLFSQCSHCNFVRVAPAQVVET